MNNRELVCSRCGARPEYRMEGVFRSETVRCHPLDTVGECLILPWKWITRKQFKILHAEPAKEEVET